MATAKVIHGLVNSKVQTRGHHSVDGNAARCPMLDKTPKSWDAIARVGARAQNQRWNRKLVSRVGGGTHHERRRPQRLPLRRRELWVDLPWRNLVVRAADRVDALVRWWHEVRGVCSTCAACHTPGIMCVCAQHACGVQLCVFECLCRGTHVDDNPVHHRLHADFFGLACARRVCQGQGWWRWRGLMAMVMLTIIIIMIATIAISLSSNRAGWDRTHPNHRPSRRPPRPPRPPPSQARPPPAWAPPPASSDGQQGGEVPLRRQTHHTHPLTALGRRTWPALQMLRTARQIARRAQTGGRLPSGQGPA